MRYGVFIILGLLLALALSWLGMIATPQFQIGNGQPTNVPPANALYPIPLSGTAHLGREVYRANGCAYCHTHVVRQEGTLFNVVLTDPGTNQPAVLQALAQLRPGLSAPGLEQLMNSHEAIVTERTIASADAAQKALADAGAEATVRVVPTGPDIARGWGSRLTVANDYLYDTPVLLGVTRLGPDLTNVGQRRPDETWHLIHLYDPKLEVPGSIMPRYPFLFEKHPRGPTPRPDALPIPGQFDIVPTQEARALATYLVNLKADVPLFEAPAPQLGRASRRAGDTNAPPAGVVDTNTPATPEDTNAPAPTQTAPP